MTRGALDKLRDQIAIARETGTFVVLTPDEAQAIIDQVSGPAVVTMEWMPELERAFKEAPGGRVSVIHDPPFEFVATTIGTNVTGGRAHIQSEPGVSLIPGTKLYVSAAVVRKNRTTDAPPYEGDDEHA